MLKSFPLGNLHFQNKNYSKLVVSLKDGHSNFLIDNDEYHLVKRDGYLILPPISVYFNGHVLVFSIYSYANITSISMSNLIHSFKLAFALRSNKRCETVK